MRANHNLVGVLVCGYGVCDGASALAVKAAYAEK